MHTFEVEVERCQRITLLIEADDVEEAKERVPEATRRTNPNEWATTRWEIGDIDYVEVPDGEAS